MLDVTQDMRRHHTLYQGVASPSQWKVEVGRYQVLWKETGTGTIGVVNQIPGKYPAPLT